MSFLLGSLISGAAGIFGAKSAANAQVEAAQKQVDLSREIYNDQKGLFEPFREGGESAFNALLYEMGLGPKPTGLSIETVKTPGKEGYYRDANPADPRARQREWVAATPGTTSYNVGDRSFNSLADAQTYVDANGTPYQGFTATPGYQYRLQEGVNALDASAASRGNLFSGATGQAVTQFGQDYGSQEYGNYLARLGSLASSGQAAAGNTANAGANFASNANNAFANQGNATAAGWIGATNAIQNGVNNYLGYQQFNKLLAG